MIGRETDLWNPLFEKILCKGDNFLKFCGSSPDNLFSQITVKIFFGSDIEQVDGDDLYFFILVLMPDTKLFFKRMISSVLLVKSSPMASFPKVKGVSIICYFRQRQLTFL